MRPLFDLTVQFYRMLQRVDRECAGKGGLKHLVRHIFIPNFEEGSNVPYFDQVKIVNL